jgi:triphosphatase
MEIELKFAVPSQPVFEQLTSLSQLDDFLLKPAGTRVVNDVYLDTADGHIRAGGFACRIRHNVARGTWFATLKSLGPSTGGLHEREEYEISILPNSRPGAWPVSKARDLALRLIQGQPLIELGHFRQVRQTRGVWRSEQNVAELSLDEIFFEPADASSVVLELEIELVKAGTVQDLEALQVALAKFQLKPEPLSKFERQISRTTAQTGAT